MSREQGLPSNKTIKKIQGKVWTLKNIHSSIKRWVCAVQDVVNAISINLINHENHEALLKLLLELKLNEQQRKIFLEYKSKFEKQIQDKFYIIHFPVLTLDDKIYCIQQYRYSNPSIRHFLLRMTQNIKKIHSFLHYIESDMIIYKIKTFFLCFKDMTRSDTFTIK